MFTLRDIEAAGDLWRVSIPLVENMSKDIVIPRPQREGPGALTGQKTTARRDGITILGFAISAHCDSTGTKTITLRSSDPAFIEGTTTVYDIWKVDVHAGANRYDQTVSPCIVPLSPAHYNPTPSDGATLQLTTNNPGGTITGTVMVWGVHGQLDIGGRRSFTGSPADYGVGF